MDEVLGGRARRYVRPRRCPTCPHELATAARAPRPHRRRDVLGSSLPRCRAPDASADQVDRGRLDRRCDHCCRFLAARWMGLVGDARAPGATGRVRLSLRRPLRADEHRHRDAASSPSRHRRSDQSDPGVRRDGGNARRALRIGDRRAADGPASLHAGGRARGRALDARRDRGLRADPREHPACRRPSLLPLPLRRDAHARLARAPPARPGRPRGAARRAARRGPRHDAARAREPLAAGARKVMAVAGHPRILLRGIDRAELASILGALGDVTTDAALVADLVVFTATADESLAELRRVAAHDDGAWRPVLVIAPDDDLCIAALDAGADAVVGPRVESAELVARARALLRIKARHDAVENQAAQFTDWTQSLVSRVAEQVEELQRVERLRRFLAPQVAEVVAGDYATLGRMGFAGGSDYGAVGTVVNLAARLCAEAQGGQILLSERAHRLVEDLVEAEPLAPLRLKGFLRPVNAVNVVALRAGPSSRTALRTPA